MKDKKRFDWRLLVTVFASILFFALVQNYKAVFGVLNRLVSVCMPIIIGLSLAFILNIPMRFFEEKAFASLNKRGGRIWLRIKRPVCMIITFLIVLTLLALLMVIIIPNLKESVMSMVNNLPRYMKQMDKYITELTERFNIPYKLQMLDKVNWDTLAKTLTENASSFIGSTITFTSGIVSALFNLGLAVVFCIYVLLSKERLSAQIKKLMYAFLGVESTGKFFSVLSLSSVVFSKFAVGQGTEALILGVLCYLGMVIFSMPYALMISSLVAVTALVPIFGALIGTVVGAFMILLVNPVQAIWFVVFFILLQQVESNIIYPKVVGKSVGLSGIWVLAAVTIGGGLFGIFGMLISVPACSVIYCLLREAVDKRLGIKPAVILSGDKNEPE